MENVQLLAAVVGGGIGIVGSLSATFVKEKVSAVKQRTKVATLLLSEITPNKNFLDKVKAISEAVDENAYLYPEELKGDHLVHPQETGAPDKIDLHDEALQGRPPAPNTEVYESTLESQGFLRRKTLKPLHKFYRDLRRAHIAWESALEDDVDRRYRAEVFKQAAGRAEKAIEVAEGKSLKGKLSAEASWNPLHRP